MVRNQLFPQHNDPIIDLTQAVEESISAHTFPREVHIEIQLHDNSIMSLDGQADVMPVARATQKRKGFVPKKSLETILIWLKNQPLGYVDQQAQLMCPKIDEKTKKQGKQTRQLQDICEIYFKNKRVSRILSRMIRNRHRQRDNPIQTITIEDRGSSENTSADCKEDSPI